MAANHQWCLVTVLEPDGAELDRFVLEGAGAPGIDAVDHLGRLALRVRRRGHRLVLTQVSPGLGGLLELTGLPVEVEWQPELPEEPIGIQEGQEEGHLDDLAP
jgi:hypothetical protein